MAERGTVKRAVFAEGVLVMDANGEQPPRNPEKDLGSTALAAETEQALPSGLPIEPIRSPLLSIK